MAVKYIIAVIVFLTCTVFFGLSAGLSWIDVTVGTTESKSSFFQTCRKGIPCTKVTTTCEKLQQGLDAGKAFSILSTILAFFALLVTGVRIAKPLVYLAIAPLKIVYYALIVCTLVAGVLNWILGFALYGSEFCGTKFMDQTGYEVGPSAPLAFVATCLILVQLILECVMEDDSVAEAAKSETEPSASS